MHRWTFLARQGGSLARAGWFDTQHGRVETPLFMPVGTQATVKSLLPTELKSAGAQMVLANAYHLPRQPGAELIATMGGLHRFMHWDRPLLTDSGGFQVFSLGHGPGGRARSRDRDGAPLLECIDENGVTIRSHLDGSSRLLTPESSMEAQRLLGADVIMAFDECLPDSASWEESRQAMERTHRWLARCRAAWHARPTSANGAPQGLFGIVQGGRHAALRRESAAFVAGLDLAGFAVGGESIGYVKATTASVLDWIAELLPEDRPRYAMGVGAPDDFFTVVARGIDMFDSVLPTRLARNGTVFTHRGRLRLLDAAYAADVRPIDDHCACSTCRTYSRAYLRHLFKAGEALGPRLASLHNVAYCCSLVRAMRDAIITGTFADLQTRYLAGYAPRAQVGDRC